MPLATVVVPEEVFRNVPALSKRLRAPATLKDALLCATNSAPGRLVGTAVAMLIAAPFQRIVPPFSSVRGPNVTAAWLLIVNVAPGLTSVRPSPVILPPFQNESLRNVNVPLPARFGVLISSPRVRLEHSVSLLTVTLTLFVMKTLSLRPGTKPGVQLVAISQSPLAGLDHVISYETRCANTVTLLVMVSVRGLFVLVRSPVQPRK